MSLEFIGTSNPTGWLCYYICDKSGTGFKRPNYLYYPTDDRDDIVEEIVRLEDWPRYASHYSLKVELGITPPVEILEKELKELSERIERLVALRSMFIEQKDHFHSGLIRN
jgi:hypothetical protein